MSLEKIINDAWENKDQVNPNSDQTLKDAINQVINDLDSGKSRVAEKINGEWVTHQHLKKAIMLSFRIYPMENLNGPYSSWYDKAHLLKGKTAGWTKEDHERAGFRMVPNSPVRKGSFVGKDAGYVPKPEAKTFDLMVEKFGLNPKETIYIEDIAKNLSIGYERGCATVWLINDEHFGKLDSDKNYISHKIKNLSLFLKEIRLLKSQ